MNGCIYRTRSDLCMKFTTDQSISFCVGKKCQDRKESNADRIRSMSDEELATFLFHAWNNASWCSAKKDCPDDDSCLPCWLDWIRQEAEEGER